MILKQPYIKVYEPFLSTALVDDRLQTTCNKSGKHDCRCEEEDASPLSPTIRTNGERKRRRSLPCGPAESPVTSQPAPLPSLQEGIPQKHNINLNLTKGLTENNAALRTNKNKSENRNEVRTCNNLNSDSDHLERWFKLQLRIDERENNMGKRCKRTSIEIPTEIAHSKSNINRNEESYNNIVKNSTYNGKESGSSSTMISIAKSGSLLDNFASAGFRSFVSSLQTSTINSKFQSFRGREEEQQMHFNVSGESYKPLIIKDASNHALIDPYAQPNPFHESNPGPSTQKWTQKFDNSACTVHQSCSKNVNRIAAETQISTDQEVNNEDNTVKSEQRKAGKPDFSQLMWKLTIPDEKDKREEGGLLDWFSKVPGRVLGVAATKGYVDSKIKNGCLNQPIEHTNGQNGTNEIKFKNCNLELSQREVDEVLAVLRARTPSGRRRPTVKNVRRRGERSEKGGDHIVEKVLAKCTILEEELIQDNSTNRHVETCQVQTPKFCENCNRGLCKKIDHQMPEEQPSLDRIYYDKNVYQPAHSKFPGNTNRLNEKTETRASNDTDCLRTKADMLLGAILRTSRDRKDLSDDSSNGTRTTSIDEDSSDDDFHSSNVEKFDQQDHKIIPSSNDEEKSLPLNKKFSRFRQLFKKEVDKRIAMISDESSLSSLETSPNLTPPQRFNSPSFRYNNELPNLHNARINKARRQIDFTNFSEITEKKEDGTLIPKLSTKNAHQKLVRKMHSTNYNDRECDSAGLNNRQNHRDSKRLLEDTKESSENEQRDENAKKEMISVIQKNNLTTPQCGNSSSKIHNNNHKDGIAETGDDETVDKSVPSALEQEKFRRSLENAASMVFHSRTGLPLTSSPAPLRRGSCCFDYDSSLNSVSSKRKYDI